MVCPTLNSEQQERKIKTFFPKPSIQTAKLWLFLKSNLIISSLLFLAFLIFNPGYDLLSFLFAVFAAISTISTAYLIFALLLIPFLFIKRSAFYIAFILFVLCDFLIVADFFIFRLYKMHINPMILNLVFSPAAQDSVHIGIIPLISIVVTIILFILLELFILKNITNIDNEKAARLNRKSRLYFVLPIFLIILSEKFTFGYASLTSNTKITQKALVVPLYQPLTFNRFAKRHFGIIPPKKAPTLPEDSSLSYPLKKLAYEKMDRLPNIFIFGSDATRADMIKKEIMPNLYDFSKKSVYFINHHSGGNTTRFGIFSLFYGLNATYWFSFLNEQKGSLLFDALMNRGYNINITTSTNLQWPEFRKTAFVDIQDRIKDDFEGEPWERDRQNTDYFKNWLAKQKTDKPIFSYVFFDSSHLPYSYPKEHAIFLPDGDMKINFMTVGKKKKTKLFNMYKNANHYVDSLYKELIDAVKKKGLFDNSIIILTSDHGEEFFEYGGFGHNNSFCNAQTNSFLIVKTPDSKPRTVDNLTSHVDIVPFLMKSIGVVNDAGDYSNGTDILKSDRESVSISNWNNYAIRTKEYTIVFSKKPSAMLAPEIRKNSDYKIDKNKKLDDFNLYIMKSLNESSRFYK
ncbi:MAG: hypothetical protein B5M52_03065 [Helicobacteraceae bacterium 4484_230]|nr:MAG: hypothetical protein B5M52_03065 [Helicobacteraceae bacterium 4484_230]